MSVETVNWKVEGITCSNCALTISKYLEKEGLQNVQVNPIDGEVRFEADLQKDDEARITKGISGLGYKVVDSTVAAPETKQVSIFLKYFLFCLPFTLVLMMHMFSSHASLHWLMNPWLQMVLCLPVYITGMYYFGVSAVKGLIHRSINMNVLVTLGATAAFFYSLTGTILHLGNDYIFYETAATIITLVFVGNFLEDSSIATTQKALNSLVKSQKVIANIIGFDEHHQEVVMPLENSFLKSGDLILVRSGEQVPADCKILWGEAQVDESIVTGESVPLHKTAKDVLIGGSLVTDGNFRAQVISNPGDSILAKIIGLVKKAQSEKPPLQLLADKISGIFVPTVIGIALVTFGINYYLFGLTAGIMRTVAVLVIACPCAMGLATPAAIAVGLGRAAKNGVLFRNAKSLENFSRIKQVIFDKTGTLTTGVFKIKDYQAIGVDESEFKTLLYSLEKHSNHPIAKIIAREWKTGNAIRWQRIDELKGIGMVAETKSGDVVKAGSYSLARDLTNASDHNVYVVKNGHLIGWVDLEDSIRPEVAGIVEHLHKKGIKTVLLSGDRLNACKAVAQKLGLDEVYAEQTPMQKQERVEALNAVTPSAMLGDGINDAPALAKSTIGISLSDASQLAMQTADVVLLNKGLNNFTLSLGLGYHTFLTIRQNLFWAFAYNVVAIPVAAFGLLTPTVAALVMGLSDVVLAINSVRLFYKNVER